MGKRTRKLRVVEAGTTTLGELIHERIRGAIEQAVAEELEAALGRRYERIEGAGRRGYRHGTRLRTLTGPTVRGRDTSQLRGHDLLRTFR